MKKDIVPIGEALEKVLNIRGVKFKWKNLVYGPNDKKKIGFIAQEVQPYIPEVIHTNGKNLTMNYKEMIAINIEALKEQEIRISSLELRGKKVLEVAKTKGII